MDIKESRILKKKEIISNVIWIVGLAVVLLLVRMFVFSPVIVSGHSMDPTLKDRERVIALKNKEPKRFDIVTFPAPDEPKTSYIKRVIGLPGDEIEYKDDQLYVNGKKLAEPYLDQFKSELPKGEDLTGDFKATVPEGTYFVMGDNRKNSKDSRMIGPIEKDKISGNVKFAFWPVSKFGLVK